MQSKSNSKYEIDMCNGPLAGKMLLFAIPLMLSGIVQLLFNSVDMIVVGRFVGSRALAAVGSTSSLIFLLTSLFMGLSVGTNILTAKYYGAKRSREMSEVIHTSVALSLLCGLLLAGIGIIGARPLLLLMGTPDDVLDMAVLYMRIYFIGMPFSLMYNLCSAALRAVGDTRRPLYFLLLSGIINLCLNLFFVLVLHLNISGVALATVCSQALSAILVLYILLKSEGGLKLEFKKVKLYRSQLIPILRIGVPASLQSILFSFSNVLIQSSINSFGSIAMAGSTAAANIESYVTTSMNAFHQTAISFTSQNHGAGNYKRIIKVLKLSLIYDISVALLFGNAAYIFGTPLLGIYTNDSHVIALGLLRLSFTCVPYFLLGIMDIFVGCLRGLGYSMLPTIVSLAGACGLRVLWILTVFRCNRSLQTLYISYPITWGITALIQFICTLCILKKIKPRNI